MKSALSSIAHIFAGCANISNSKSVNRAKKTVPDTIGAAPFTAKLALVLARVLESEDVYSSEG